MDGQLLRLLAETLDVDLDTSGTVDPFTIIERALDALGIKIKMPGRAKHVGLGSWPTRLQRGDHIIVREMGSNAVFHHSISVGLHTRQGAAEEEHCVVDMYGAPDEGKQGATLRLRTMDEFLSTSARPELAVIHYNGDTTAARMCSAALALHMQQCLADCTGLYHLLGCNCQHFASWCRTLRWGAHLHTVLAITHDVIVDLPPCRCARCPKFVSVV
jgi:hypothetical protein